MPDIMNANRGAGCWVLKTFCSVSTALGTRLSIVLRIGTCPNVRERLERITRLRLGDGVIVHGAQLAARCA